jgi:hypothetical protein
MTTENDTRALAMLAFWGRNVAPIRARGWNWPGFDYSEAEWKRLLTLGKAVSTAAYALFAIATAALMIAAIGIVVAIGTIGIVLPLYDVMPPPWAPAGLFGLLAAIALAMFALFGYGFPLAMRLAAGLATNAAMRAKLAAAPGDDALAAKITRQFRRMAAFIAVVFVLIAASEA